MLYCVGHVSTKANTWGSEISKWNAIGAAGCTEGGGSGKSLAPLSPLNEVSVFCCGLHLWNTCPLNAKFRPGSVCLALGMMMCISEPIKHRSFYTVGRKVLST